VHSVNLFLDDCPRFKTADLLVPSAQCNIRQLNRVLHSRPTGAESPETKNQKFACC